MKPEPPVSGPRAKKTEGKPVTRGLPSIEDARQNRRKLQLMPPKFWAWAAVFIGAGIIVWWKIEEGQIVKMRSELLARQRAVEAELGPRWRPLQAKIERWTLECAAEPLKEVRGEALVKSWDFRGMDGIYLRLARSAAVDAESIRAAAKRSLHDGFTSCLMLAQNREPLAGPLAGPRCETTQDCERGQLCNDYKHCAAYSQPYNLRLAYKTMHVLSDEYVREVQGIGKKIVIRGAVATFEALDKYDLPVAATLLSRAKYFLVVVDEPASKADKDAANDDLPDLPDVADAGAADDRNIPTAPHKARVCVWRLSDDRKMVALRLDAAGALMGGGGRTLGPETRVAMQRQANSCALALALREAIGVSGGSAPPASSATP